MPIISHMCSHMYGMSLFFSLSSIQLFTELRKIKLCKPSLKLCWNLKNTYHYIFLLGNIFLLDLHHFLKAPQDPPNRSADIFFLVDVLRIYDSPVLQSPEQPLIQGQWQISFRGRERTIRIGGWDYAVKPTTIPWSQQLKGTMWAGSDLLCNLLVWSWERAPFLCVSWRPPTIHRLSGEKKIIALTFPQDIMKQQHN